MWPRQVQEGDLPDPSALCFSSLVLVFLALCGGPMCLCSPKGLSLGDPVIRQCLLRLAATSLQQNAIKSRGKTRSEKLKKEGLYTWISTRWRILAPFSQFLCTTDFLLDYIACQLCRPGLLTQSIAFTLDWANKGVLLVKSFHTVIHNPMLLLAEDSLSLLLFPFILP